MTNVIEAREAAGHLYEAMNEMRARGRAVPHHVLRRYRAMLAVIASSEPDTPFEEDPTHASAFQPDSSGTVDVWRKQPDVPVARNGWLVVSSDAEASESYSDYLDNLDRGLGNASPVYDLDLDLDAVLGAAITSYFALMDRYREAKEVRPREVEFDSTRTENRGGPRVDWDASMRRIARLVERATAGRLPRECVPPSGAPTPEALSIPLKWVDRSSVLRPLVVPDFGESGTVAKVRRYLGRTSTSAFKVDQVLYSTSQRQVRKDREAELLEGDLGSLGDLHSATDVGEWADATGQTVPDALRELDSGDRLGSVPDPLLDEPGSLVLDQDPDPVAQPFASDQLRRFRRIQIASAVRDAGGFAEAYLACRSGSRAFHHEVVAYLRQFDRVYGGPQTAHPYRDRNDHYEAQLNELRAEWYEANAEFEGLAPNVPMQTERDPVAIERQAHRIAALQYHENIVKQDRMRFIGENKLQTSWLPEKVWLARNAPSSNPLERAGWVPDGAHYPTTSAPQSSRGVSYIEPTPPAPPDDSALNPFHFGPRDPAIPKTNLDWAEIAEASAHPSLAAKRAAYARA
jgi:hypothetical protein